MEITRESRSKGPSVHPYVQPFMQSSLLEAFTQGSGNATINHTKNDVHECEHLSTMREKGKGKASDRSKIHHLWVIRDILLFR